MAKEIFKTEVKKIRDLSNVLRASQKLNGTQVILNETNKTRLDLCRIKLEEAANLLCQIAAQ